MLPERDVIAIKNGRAVLCKESSTGLVKIYDCQKNFIGIGLGECRTGDYPTITPVKILSPDR